MDVVLWVYILLGCIIGVWASLSALLLTVSYLSITYARDYAERGKTAKSEIMTCISCLTGFIGTFLFLFPFSWWFLG